jgi:glycosyltransferase involved in cell wall biosynthesis
MIVTNSSTGGGAERSMNLVANELDALGHSVLLVPINRGPDDEVTLTCKVACLNRKWRGGLISVLAAAIRFNFLTLHFRPTTVILNCDLPEFLGCFLLFRRNIVGVEHVNFPWVQRPYLGRLVRKFLNFRKIKWVAVSDHLSIWPDNRRPIKTMVNPIIAKQNEFTPLRYSVKGVMIKRIVFIGRLVDQKRPDWILEICKGANLPGLIIGDGELSPTLMDFVDSNELPVEFVGQVQLPWEMIGKGDLLIVSSAYEGDGLVVVEALQQQVPFLLSDIPEFRRFDFSENVYCSSIDDFLQRVEKYRENLDSLLASKEKKDQILMNRRIEKIGQEWITFLANNFGDRTHGD